MRAILVLLAVLLLPVRSLAQTRSASSQTRGVPAPAPTLERARSSLTRYDVAGDETLAILRDLGAFAAANETPTDQRLEARFLRAMVGTDFLVIAHLTSDASLVERTSGAFGVAAQALPATLEGELSASGRGIYAGAAREQSAVLRALASASPDYATFAGIRRDALFVHALASRLPSAADPIAALASFAADPCAAGATCESARAVLSPEVRAALVVADDLAGLSRRLAQAAASGDPVSPYVASDVELATRALARVPTSLELDVPHDVALAEMARGATVESDVLVAVGGGSDVRVAYLPRLVRDGSGALRLVPAGTSPYPAFAPIPTSAPDDASTLPELVRALAANPGLRVAIAAGADVPCRSVARAIRSIREAGASFVGLAGKDPDGHLRTVAVSEPRADEAGLRVFVRTSGYEVEVGRTRTMLPRVREDGAYRFDVAGLGRVLGARRLPNVAVRFMAGAPYAALAAAVSRVSSDQPIQLALPR